MSVLQEREGDIKDLTLEIQKRNNDIAGQCGSSRSELFKRLLFSTTRCPNLHSWVNLKPSRAARVLYFFPLAGLRVSLQAEEEKIKEKETERRNLEETLDIVRKELNKTEQARKDASIKVRGWSLRSVHLLSFKSNTRRIHV